MSTSVFSTWRAVLISSQYLSNEQVDAENFRSSCHLLRKQGGEEKHVASIVEKSERTTAQSWYSPEPAASLPEPIAGNRLKQASPQEQGDQPPAAPHIPLQSLPEGAERGRGCSGGTWNQHCLFSLPCRSPAGPQRGEQDGESQQTRHQAWNPQLTSTSSLRALTRPSPSFLSVKGG